MKIVGVDELIQDLKFALAFPAVVLVMALINIRLSRYKNRELVQRVSLVFVILLFAVCLSTVVFQDRVVLIALWKNSPVVYSFVYPVCILVIISTVGYVIFWKLRPELWKK